MKVGDLVKGYGRGFGIVVYVFRGASGKALEAYVEWADDSGQSHESVRHLEVICK